MKKKIQLAIFALFCNQILAQKCITDQVNYDLLKSNLELMQKHQALYKNVPNVSNVKRSTKIIIPVVFHVMHTNGGENITKQQIEDQIRILNLDYSYNNANKSNIRSIFQGVAANFEIEFRLAKIDPQGNCTDGINRVYSSKHINAGDQVKTVPLARWPNDKYLNIWTVSSINSSGASGTILGYAYFPSTSAGASFSNLDGVIVRSDYVGSIGTSDANKAGRVLTHEIGHYLGLLHPFQDSCDGGDHCDDTPPVYGTFTNANCNPNNNSCHNDFPDLPDQFENYMDYSEGRCQAMFTLGQKAIVYNTFAVFEHRARMVSADNLIATGVADQQLIPLAGFNSSTRFVCAGQSVTFNDVSCVSNVNSRTWTFEGGDISTSNAISPSVTYASEGLYKVSLTVGNSFGTNTKSEDQYIKVFPSAAIDKGYLKQTFENPDFQAAEGWTLISEENIQAFTWNQGNAFDGNACLKAPITGSTRKGKLYRIISPKVDLRPLNGQSPKLSFMCAYAKPNKLSKDALRVYTSTDCGNTWTIRYTRSEATLYSTTYANYAFAPTQQSDWRLHTVPLTFAQNQANVMVMIEVESDGGGPLYIDNINVSQFNTDIAQNFIKSELSIFPVPASKTIQFELNQIESGNAVVEISNALGQIVMRSEVEMNENNTSMQFDLNPSFKSGIYFVNVRINNQLFTGKFITEGF